MQWLYLWESVNTSAYDKWLLKRLPYMENVISCLGKIIKGMVNRTVKK